MNLNFSQVLASLPDGAVFKIANAARPPADYLFNSLLPEVSSYSYEAKSGTMTVRTTMAGVAGMDSPYPESGALEASTFSEATAKIANRVRLPEKAIREIQQMLMYLQVNGQPTTEQLQQQVFNFADKLLVQAHLDTFEWLRGQALVNGLIDWTFNGKRIYVDYGIPAANKLTTRTGNDAYGGSTSKFWTDVQLIRQTLKRRIRAMIAHSDTIDEIIYNSVNAAVVLNESDNAVTIVRRAGGTSTAEAMETDNRYRVTLIPYSEESEILDLSNPGQTVLVPFMARGKLLAIGTDARTRYTVIGEGSTEKVDDALGYTHLAPSTEGGGMPGRWAEVYTPEQQPWSLEGRAVTNGLPVIEDPEKIVVATTAMS